MNFKIDSKSIEDDAIQSRSMSDPTLSDIDFKNDMAEFNSWVQMVIQIFPSMFLYLIINVNVILSYGSLIQHR